MAKGKTLSPMMVHYNKIKEKYPDCVVFYRLGDFYEMFFDDAVRVSKMLDLLITPQTNIFLNLWSRAKRLRYASSSKIRHKLKGLSNAT